MFVWGKNDLNPEQEKAIYNENSILLIACPGSGKTRTITYKIAYELSKLESNKQYIVAITYTNRAADEIKERIELLGVDTEQLWIGTIHSFCVEWILKPYHMYIEELRFGYDIINTNDTENYLVSLCVIVKTCSDICFTIGQKNCQMFVAKLHKFHHPHNRMRFYPAHSVLSFPDFAVDTFLPQRFLR